MMPRDVGIIAIPMEPIATCLRHPGSCDQGPVGPQRFAASDRSVLIIHGRSGGAIPDAVSALQRTLEPPSQQQAAQRQVPVVVLTSPVPLARQLEGLLSQPVHQQHPPWLLPLFAAPGEHVVHDVPAALASLTPTAKKAIGRRLPFLGSWPALHALLVELVFCLRSGGEQPLLLLHPSSQPLSHRFQRMLTQRIGVELHCPTLAALPGWLASLGRRDVLVTLQMANNRYDDHIRQLLASRRDGPRLLPPLLYWPRVQRLIRHGLERV